jgi:hypothetical protein
MHKRASVNLHKTFLSMLELEQVKEFKKPHKGQSNLFLC